MKTRKTVNKQTQHAKHVPRNLPKRIPLLQRRQHIVMSPRKTINSIFPVQTAVPVPSPSIYNFYSSNSTYKSPFSGITSKPSTISSPLSLFSRFMSRFTPDEEKEHREIEAWYKNFDISDIPVESFDKNFSRSRGAGGQHVNKTSSKAELRFNLASQTSWLHPKVIERIKVQQSRYINQQGQFVITSEVNREQHANLQDCVKKIYDIVGEASKVPSETSPEQKKKVEQMKAAQKQRDIEYKKRMKEKKQDRRGD